MEVHILGSGGFMPFPDAQLPSVLIREDGSNYLFDVGEGTQMRMVEQGLSRADLDGVFISHMHGDHVLGLPGVLIRRHQESGKHPLILGGPSDLRPFIDQTLDSIRTKLNYELRHKNLDDDRIITLPKVWVGTARSQHRVDGHVFAIGSRQTTRKFHPDQARKLGVPEGPLWGQLQSGETIQLEDGRTIEPDQVSDPPDPGPKVAYIPDTRPLDDLPGGFSEPDVLIHEAMFLDRHADHAKDKGHCTAHEAAAVAERLGAGQLILVHASRRYDDPTVLQQEARERFEESYLAHDGMCVSI